MARKSRVITETEKKETAKAFEWKIGIYIRLSKEDLRNNDESESVTNQRKINLEFVEEKFWHKSISFTTFMLMMAVLEQQKIHALIFKGCRRIFVREM